MAGMFEVEAGTLAQTQGVDAQVRAFGHRMVTDHAAINTQLLQIVGAGTPLARKLDADIRQDWRSSNPFRARPLIPRTATR